MKRFFPIMSDDTEKGMHFAVLAYWIFAFWFLPFWLPFVADGYWYDLPTVSWFEIVYHILNAVVVACVLKTYLQDSFYQVLFNPKKFFLTTGIAAIVMVALVEVLYIALGYVIKDCYPISEMTIALTSGLMVEGQPIFGTICHTVFTPFAVVGLFYATGFAPVCRRSRWLGYLVVTVVLALPCAFEILWRGQKDLVIPIFVMQLPVHLVACWTYQKLDTVWAPIATLAVFNFGTSLLALI